MNPALLGITAMPTIVALLVFCVFSYLYNQTRESYFRAWQFGWLAFLVHHVILTWNAPYGSTVASWAANILLVVTALCIFASARLVKKEYHLHRSDAAIAIAGFVWATLCAVRGNRPWQIAEGIAVPRVPVELGIVGLLLFTAWRFFEAGRRRDSFANRLLAISIVSWAGFLLIRQNEMLSSAILGGTRDYFEAVPQMLIAISMVMVLFDNERRAVQENLLAFSRLDVDTTKIVSPGELGSSMERFLERLAVISDCRRVAICVMDQWNEVFPSAQRGFSAEFLAKLRQAGAADLLPTIAYRRGGLAVFHDMETDLGALPVDEQRAGALRQLLTDEKVKALTCVSIQTHDRNFGAMVFAHPQGFGSSQIRLLTGLAMQIGMTLENHLLMHHAHRRRQEYELLTQIGQAVSSRLDSDEVLRAVQKELGVLFDTRNFYIALVDNENVHYEFEVEDGQPKPKRMRAAAHGLTEHIVRTGKPVLVRSNMDEFRSKMGVSLMGRPAKCYAGVPIFRYEKAIGVMAAMNYEREFAYDKRDLEVMQTAAGQVSVAMENARLFTEEQRRGRHLGFLNNISRLAISSETAEQMVAEIVREIQKHFKYDHIGIGILDYASKEIEIKAEAGSTAQALGRRIPLGIGILGRCARSGDVVLVQDTGENSLAGIMPSARSVMCVPITYGETLMGVLNIESEREHAFSGQEELIFRTLGDLLATALHNAFVFQKMQQQSITDGLTGIKTRRFFLEALQAEWKRAARSGRAFSVVLIDLDGFKQVNDKMGHLEGDLVLARIGRLLEQKCRQSNVVARYGGDEFVILMPETTVDQAQILAERLRMWIATDPMLNERAITGSFGVATFPLHGASAEDIVRVADAGMYVSKRAGGNHVSIAEEFSSDESVVNEKRMVASFVESILQRDYTGPDGVPEMLAQLRTLNNMVQPGRNQEAMTEAVRLLTTSAESRETAGAGHGEATARYAGAIARELGIYADELDDIIFAARVHDVGKIFIAERILNKPAPLNEDERRMVKGHPASGAAVVDLIPDAERLRLYVRHHHERMDGTGYPDGVKGEQIPLGSRIIAVAESFAAMTSERPYAKVHTPDEALAEMEERSGTQYDGMLVRLLREFLKGAATQTASAGR
jgi:diguanylate cyclase (GGDEF)-like protein